MELNLNGINSAIKANILSDEKMKEIGFTNNTNDSWHFFRDLGNEISFNVSIQKNNTKNLKIDILDENFLQHYDYQRMLRGNPNFKQALEVKEKVEKWMKYLQDNNVLSGHIYGEYI